MFTALPFLLEAAYGLSPVVIGLVVTAEAVGSTAAATQNARLARHVSDGRIITGGFAAVAAGFAGAWLAPTPSLIGVATFVFGVGRGVTLPSIDTGVSDLVPTRFRGGALSPRGSASFLGRAAGPLLFAAMGIRIGYRPLMLLGGIGAFAMGALPFVLSR